MRGTCSFEGKILNAQNAGAVAAIVFDDTNGNTLLTMNPATANSSQVAIPSVFITLESGTQLTQLVMANESSSAGISVLITADQSDDGGNNQDSQYNQGNHWSLFVIIIIISVGFLAIPIMSFVVSPFFIAIMLVIRQRRKPKPIPHHLVVTIPTREIVEEDLGEDNNCICAICLEDYEAGTEVRHLPCNHEFHPGCIDPWLTSHTRYCPVCKMDVGRGIKLSRREASEEVNNELVRLNTHRPSTTTMIHIPQQHPSADDDVVIEVANRIPTPTQDLRGYTVIQVQDEDRPPPQPMWSTPSLVVSEPSSSERPRSPRLSPPSFQKGDVSKTTWDLSDDDNPGQETV